MNRGALFYVFYHFILSWDPPNMIIDPNESSHDVSVHLRPPAQLSPLDQTWAMMHVRVRPGGCRLNLQEKLNIFVGSRILLLCSVYHIFV